MRTLSRKWYPYEKKLRFKRDILCKILPGFGKQIFREESKIAETKREQSIDSLQKSKGIERAQKKPVSDSKINNDTKKRQEKNKQHTSAHDIA